MRGTLLKRAASAALLVGLGLAGTANAQSAPELVVGQPTIGEISAAAEHDRYRLRIEEGQRYRFTLNATGESEAALDPVLTLFNAAGEQIAMNDDGGDGSLNSALSYSGAAGEIFAEASGFLEESTGGYTLSVSAAAVPPDNAGNDAATRARVTAGRALNGSLEYEGDTDWYRFAARTGQRYHVTLTGAEGEGALGDPLLRVTGESGEEIAVNDDSEGSLNSALDFTPTASGDVFIEASAFGGAATGAYTLAITATRAPTDNLSADVRTRGRLTAGGSANDTLDFANDSDWRRIRLESGQSYRFTLNSNSGSDTPLGDPLLRLYSSEGVEVAADDDGGEGFSAYLEYTAPETGNYFVEARGFTDDATGAYTISAAAGDIPADASTDITLSADGDFREGMLSPAGDVDWYRINLAEGQGLRFAVTSPQGMADALGDPFIVVHGPDGAELAQDDDGGEGLSAWLEFTAAAAGAHYLEVRGFSQETAQGRYVVQVTPGEIGASTDQSEPMAVNGEGRASTISAAGDADWYSLDLVEGRSYRFNLEGADGALDPVLTLYDGAGTQIATDDDGGAGTNAYLTYIPLASGVHFIGASGFDQSVGAYYLRIADTDVPGGMGTDEVLADGDDRVSRIDMPGDTDSYMFAAEAGVRYTIEVKGHGDNPLTDPFVTVLNESGERVSTDDDSGDGLDARLRFTTETAGQYIVQASGLGGSTGWYQVSVVRATR